MVRCRTLTPQKTWPAWVFKNTTNLAWCNIGCLWFICVSEKQASNQDDFGGAGPIKSNLLDPKVDFLNLTLPP